MRPRSTFSLPAALLAVAFAVGAPSAAPLAAQAEWGPVADGMPRTAAEESGFQRHTRHDEMWSYLEGLRANSTEMRLGTYGETRSGRRLPYAVFSRPLVSEPWEAWTLERPVLVLAANVHGDERTFREGLLVLMRDMATPGTEANALLDDLVVVVAPQINPDGFEASEGGQRGNAWGIDLNRDYVKLEHPSIQGYIENLIGAFRPHLFVDGHNGGSYPYNLNYQCTSAFDPAPSLTAICDDGIFPAIDAMLGTEGYRSYYYQRGNAEEWLTGGWQARIGRNYGGFANSVAILFEAPGVQSMEDGARAGYLGYLAVMDWSARNADELMRTVRDARIETLALGQAPDDQVAVQQDYEPEDEPATYDIMAGSQEEIRAALQDGGTPEVRTITDGRLMKKPVATVLRDRPYAYLLPRDAVDAVAMLRRHGITVERLLEETELQVQAYSVAGVSYERAYNHAAATRVEVGEVTTVTRTFPAGTYMVSTGQMLGRLVSHMLEVETDDNVVYWNTMDAWIPRPGQASGGSGQQDDDGPPLVPIFKLMEPTALPTVMVQER
ncbi:MAG TPA: M14 family zinc carboxypeptidase [Longimicrobiales bacterium]|nr:M14 family zinc carboxypeptidase [Longimicrobiales bacterium]